TTIYLYHVENLHFSGSAMLTFLYDTFLASWELLQQASIYILFGLLVGGLLKVFLSPAYVASHLGSGRFSSVFKAALLGIPIPLCSCGVLPAAASLKKQGANNGATTAFLISTPESGVDSISITWALLDPIMTIARPVSAFISAFTAGIAENFLNPPDNKNQAEPDLNCPIDNCCDGIDCPPEAHKKHHSFFEKSRVGLKYAATDLWADLAGWFFVGILLAGLINVLIPDAIISRYLGGGLSSMLLMLTFGIPLYICATASTPIAAAFIMKGVSPGTALVFLLVGPATNITSLSVLFGLLGKRATALYLLSIAVVSVLCGLAVDAIYFSLGISAVAAVGHAAEILPAWLMTTATLLLLALSIRPLYNVIRGWFGADDDCGCSSGSCATDADHGHDESPMHSKTDDTGCGCGSSCEPSDPIQLQPLVHPGEDKK
ncbi:MAG: SO_0444 family Cu/Zn efflux transporter, partial [Methylococcales bacterium]|nr:SO_0444 family Cu/Zn efflux transporter [Methylococcales bacterium]